MKKFIIGLLMAAMLIGGVNGFNSDNNGGALPVEKQQTVQEDTGSIQKAFAAGKSTMKVHYIEWDREAPCLCSRARILCWSTVETGMPLPRWSAI